MKGRLSNEGSLSFTADEGFWKLTGQSVDIVGPVEEGQYFFLVRKTAEEEIVWKFSSPKIGGSAHYLLPSDFEKEKPHRLSFNWSGAGAMMSLDGRQVGVIGRQLKIDRRSQPATQGAP